MRPYYEHAGITIYHGDVANLIGSLEFDAIVSDPPYGIGKDYGELSKDDIQTFQRFVSMIAATGKPASVCMSVSRLYDLPVRPQWTGVWNKPLSMSGLIAYPIYPHWEPIAFYNIKGDYAGNKGHRSDVFECYPEPARNSDHPTPKPLGLMSQLIQFFRDAKTILDPSIGSGTTLVAAKNAGRNAIGVEIEERWCELAAKRLSQEVLCFA